MVQDRNKVIKQRGTALKPVDNSGNTGHPERDQFREGKIGSGFMSTIAGQPNLDQFAREREPGSDTANKVKPVNEPSPSPVER